MLANLGLGNIPGNVVLLVEEDMGDVKSVFVQMAAQELLRDMKKIVYLSTARSREEIRGQISLPTSEDENNNLVVLGSFDDLRSLLYICQKDEKMCTDANKMPDPLLNNLLSADICIIDTFSYLFMEEDTGTIKDALNSFVTMSRENKTTFLLLSDMGILTDRSERIIRSMADGIIQFRTEYMGSKINRYINIPKMPGNPPLNRMVPFNVTGRGIAIDTRERVG
jgi:KaiC/GvpD/RAD55 family RecA-like ATPase